MMHHYITKYVDENEHLIVEAWIQMNLFGRCFCFSKRRIDMGAAHAKATPMSSTDYKDAS